MTLIHILLCSVVFTVDPTSRSRSRELQRFGLGLVCVGQNIQCLELLGWKDLVDTLGVLRQGYRGTKNATRLLLSSLRPRMLPGWVLECYKKPGSLWQLPLESTLDHSAQRKTTKTSAALCAGKSTNVWT